MFYKFEFEEYIFIGLRKNNEIYRLITAFSLEIIYSFFAKYQLFWKYRGNIGWINYFYYLKRINIIP